MCLNDRHGGWKRPSKSSRCAQPAPDTAALGQVSGWLRSEATFMAGCTGTLNIHSSKTRATGHGSTTVTAGQALCHALLCLAPKHLGCSCGSSPFCLPGKERSGFSASLLQQWGGRGAEGRLASSSPWVKLCSPSKGHSCRLW